MLSWSTAFSDDLAERWDDYVDCRKRLRREGPFLQKILSGSLGVPVLDAAMALGCEAVFLASQDFFVIGNEVDYRLRRHAEFRAREIGVRIEVTAVDWRDLAAHFAAESMGAILILGNSLGLLANTADRRRVCEQVYSILRPGGLFVVDQRNYDYMFRDRGRVLEGEFRYSGEIMYCERTIVGRPVMVEVGRVRMACFDRFTGRQLGHFDLHPFLEDELDELLRSSGFRAIERFFDFDGERPDHWDFLTLVGHK